MDNKPKTTILGLDLGTNSIGWALNEKSNTGNEGKILGMGSRIIPMPQDVLGKFDSGVSISQTAERTNFRSIRRLRERHLLRRERLHRVLNILGCMPQHYVAQIDFEKHLGKFIPETEPKIAYAFNAETNKAEFIFKFSFEEMLQDFSQHQPQLTANNKKVPYDWTIYYLRKKALSQKIEKEELAWLLLHFNQKRGYYQLRGEEEDETPANKTTDYYSLKVKDVIDTNEKNAKKQTLYKIILENDWEFIKPSNTPVDWKDKTKDFIVTTEKDEKGIIKKRTFRAPAEDDWNLLKKKTEHDIEKSNKEVGEYIYDVLLQQPDQKIKGKLVRVIERKFYKQELKRILQTQKEFHSELANKKLFHECIEELYPYNEPHKNSLLNTKDFFSRLFIDDIIFYQRPLKSKKSLITNCKFETRTFRDADGNIKRISIKGIAKSHPLFQEFRLWQFIQNLKIYKKNEPEDTNVTADFFKTEDDRATLFEWLNDKKEIDQKKLLKEFLKIKNVDEYRWNYVEDKTYPANETRALMLKFFKPVSAVFLTKEREEALWHILYSVENKNDIQKALKTFGAKNNLDDDFVEQFKKFPRIEKEYGSYSAKAIKKLLPLMRLGKFWNEKDIIENISAYQKNIQTLLANLQKKDERITEEKRLQGKSINKNFFEKLQSFSDGNVDAYKGLEHFLTSYLVYGKHSEDSDVLQWKTPDHIENFLKEFRQHSLRNPIVERVITETLRVVKDVWHYYGNDAENFFDEIHLELGREMKNPAEKRKQITNQINENENTNLRIKALLAELINEGDVENVRPYSPMQREILKIYEEGVLSAVNGNAPDDIIRISKQALPTSAELKRYKLWLDQGYHSPYTGKAIPLSRLFTRDYDIEHIIPQSRYFDDSLSNKVICETEINNDKGNKTAYEYIKQNSGAKITLSNGKEATLFKLEDYEHFVKTNFAKNRGKLKKLLMEEPPEDFIERQLNDSRYISKVVKNLLSNIVREDNEQEAISKNVVPVTGAITSQMKQDWGLEHIWNELIAPRFIRLNEMTQSKNFGDINSATNKFLPQVPLDYQKGYSRKRIDHRHHALDALVIACVTREHVNYLNSLNSENRNYSLIPKLREIEKVIINGKSHTIPKEFRKPWQTFTQDARNSLQNIIVSFKQNLRIINKTTNYYQMWQKDENGEPIKRTVKQTKGESIAIRKSLHKDTVSGLVKLKFRRTVSLSSALNNWQMITDKSLRLKIKDLIQQGFDKKKLIKYFKEAGNAWNNKDINRVEIFYWDIDEKGIPNNAATRVKLDETFNTLMINCVTDTGIQKILFNHLYKYNEEKNGKIIEHPELAFSSDGIDTLNKNIVELNDGKTHQTIYKVRTYEPRGNKFNIGEKGNKKAKYVEAAKGTNLFFAIYKVDSGNRTYATVPLNIVIERKKQKLSPVPETNEAGDKLLFYLSPNDLVYILKEDQKNDFQMDGSFPNKEQKERIYKVVSFTNNRLYAIPHYVAKSIVDKFEYTQLNKLEFSLDKLSIKDNCIKINVNRLGSINSVL